MIIRSIVTFILLISIPSNAQILSGFAGKRTVIKTDLLKGNGLGFKNIDLEILMHPNFTFGFAFRKYNNDKIKQITDAYQSIALRIQEKRGSVDFNLFEFNIRYYITTAVVPSPYGIYVFASHNRGKGIVKCNQDILDHQTESYSNHSFSLKDIGFRNYQIGMGKQKVLNNYFTLDYGFSLGLNQVVSKTNIDKLSNIAPFIGEHLMSSSYLRISDPIENLIPKKGEYFYHGKTSMNNFALFIYLKIGIMLF